MDFYYNSLENIKLITIKKLLPNDIIEETYIIDNNFLGN